MRSIFGRVLDTNPPMVTRKGRKVPYVRFLKATGHKGLRAPKRYTGYHQLMPLAERKALALRLQRQAAD